MSERQKQASARSMAEWLGHPQELGKYPAKLECAGEFELHEMRYYIFRYKKFLLGKWLLGVCGGYEDDGTDHCGHVFSQREEYDPAIAEEKAVKMVEQIRAYWMQKAEQIEKGAGENR